MEWSNRHSLCGIFLVIRRLSVKKSFSSQDLERRQSGFVGFGYPTRFVPCFGNFWTDLGDHADNYGCPAVAGSAVTIPTI